MHTPDRREAAGRQAQDLASPATQIVRDREAYLGQSADIGRRLSEDQFELFVTGDATEALQRELRRLAPRYIALHDVGTSTSLRLLASMAKSTQGRVMRLSVRRQGHGVALATLQFVEITSSDGTTIRAYSTDIDADTHTRHQMALTLLSQATLAVLAVGELPSHALRRTLQPLLEAVLQGPWPNREMLLVPLGQGTALATQAAALSAGGVNARVTPRAAKPSDAWSFVGGAWVKLMQGLPATPGAAKTGGGDAEAPTEPMGLRAADQPAAPSAVNWPSYVQRCASIKGIVSCEVFDRSSGRILAHVGGRSSAELLHALAERLLVTASEVGAMLGVGTVVSDAQISYPTHHVLLHSLPQHPDVVLHAVLDAAHGNLLLARTQLQRIEPE